MDTVHIPSLVPTPWELMGTSFGSFVLFVGGSAVLVYTLYMCYKVFGRKKKDKYQI